MTTTTLRSPLPFCVPGPRKVRPTRRGRSPLAWLIVAGLLAVSSAHAAGTFYVDDQSPSATDSGPGTETTPYKTISAAVTAHWGPGTLILVKPGVYREQVNIGNSGGATSSFVIRALGAPVTVDGADDFSSTAQWTPTSNPDVWLAKDVTWGPRQVFMDGARLDSVSVLPLMMPARTFRWISPDGLYVNAGGGNPGSRDEQLLVGRREWGFHMSGRSYITIDGFTITRNEVYGIDVADGSIGVVVTHNTIASSGTYGIRIAGGSGNVIDGNVVFGNRDHGIALVTGATNCTIRDNESFGNAHPTTRLANGIFLFSSPVNTLYRNRVHDNQDSGIHLQSGSNDCVLYLNRSWNNGDHGFDHLYATGALHVCDVASGNYKDGFSIEGFATGTRLFDCIAVNNGLTSKEYDLWVDPNSGTGFVSDDNIFWNSTSRAPFKYGTTEYATLSAYQAASGQDAHTIQQDPKFVDAVDGDFHLRPGSPAIDSGDSAVPYWPTYDADNYGHKDDPATSNTGSGPIAYGDRGAFEFVPSDNPPIVTAPVSAFGTEGQALTVNVTAFDPNGDAITSLTAAGLPAGATFTTVPGNTSGTLVWTPTAGQAGSYTITFRASNAVTGTTTTYVTVAPRPANQPPVAVLSVSPSNGLEPLTATADASGSLDPDGTVLSYRFDFGDGVVVGPQASPTASHIFEFGEWVAILTVTDADGASDTASVPVVVREAGSLPNLVRNPSFEQNLNGWNSYSGGTLARVPGGQHGAYALQITEPTAMAPFGVNDSPNWVTRIAGTGQTYRFSAWIRSEASRGSCRLRVREYEGSTRLEGLYSQPVTLSSSWQIVTVDYLTVGSSSTLDFQVVDFPDVPGEIFLVDNVSIRNLSGGTASGGSGSPGAQPLLGRVSPLPVHSLATLSFTTTKPGPLQVDLFDANGRRVRQLLLQAYAPAGLYELPVNGQDGEGSLSTGMYFFHIRAAEGASSGRVVVVK